MSTNKKALFFDIDGTILSEVTGKIPESASAALQKAHDLGHLLFINTGRTICCLPPMICRLPFSGYLCGCGSYIVYNDEVLTSTQIPKERQAEIIRQVKAGFRGPVLWQPVPGDHFLFRDVRAVDPCIKFAKPRFFGGSAVHFLQGQRSGVSGSSERET